MNLLNISSTQKLILYYKKERLLTVAFNLCNDKTQKPLFIRDNRPVVLKH